MMEMRRYLEYGREQARVELESNDPRFPTPDDLGTVVACALAGLLADRWGEAGELRRRVRAGSLLRRELARDAAAELPALLRLAGEVAAPPARLVDLTVDALLSERLSPALRLAAAPRPLPPEPLHALVFSAFPHVTNELYPLMVDACVAGLEGGAPLCVAGVHEEWLHGGRMRRAILFDPDSLGLVEADLAEPAAPRTAQALALNLAEEAACHARIAQALGDTPLLNPAAGARRLDDKAATAAIWQQAGLDTPAFLAVADPADAREAVARFAAVHGPALIIKPPDGTEGRGVTRVDGDAPRGRQLLDRLPAGSLLCARRGSLRYAAPGGPVPCTVRLNVCWDGNRAWAESGYAQVADSPDGIASAGRGGRLQPLREVWTRLCRADGSAVPLTPDDWQALLRAATEGVEALARALGGEMPALVGVDLLLDDGADGVRPVLLEANPRPAGLSHARLLTPDGPGLEPGVSLRLWTVARPR